MVPPSFLLSRPVFLVELEPLLAFSIAVLKSPVLSSSSHEKAFLTFSSLYRAPPLSLSTGMIASYSHGLFILLVFSVFFEHHCAGEGLSPCSLFPFISTMFFQCTNSFPPFSMITYTSPPPLFSPLSTNLPCLPHLVCTDLT